MRCPKCGLENPPIAERCDCGYDFATRSMQESYLALEGLAPVPSDEVRAKGQRDMAVGGIVFVFGIAMAILTYFMATPGGYVIASGAKVLGLIWIVRGLRQSQSGIDRALWDKRR